MPQLFALALIGAGAYAGYKWLSKQVQAANAAAVDAAEQMRRAAEQAAGNAPKDLGRLEWDAQSGVYKPRGPSST